MLELNVVTAIPIGAAAAFLWSCVLLRKLLRAPLTSRLSGGQKSVVYLAAAGALLPALIIGFTVAGFLSVITVLPGAWSHLTLAIAMVFGLAVMGTLIPVAAGWAVAKYLLRKDTPHG